MQTVLIIMDCSRIMIVIIVIVAYTILRLYVASSVSSQLNVFSRRECVCMCVCVAASVAELVERSV